MAVQCKVRIMPSGVVGGGPEPVTNLPQKSSATFEIGAPVKASAGTVVAASTTASLGTGSTLTGVAAASANTTIGFAGVDAASGATTNCNISRIFPGAKFVGNVIHGTASSAKITAANLNSTVYLAKQTASDVHYGFSIDTAGSFGATFIQGKIVKSIDAYSTVNGRIEVEITGGGLFLGSV